MSLKESQYVHGLLYEEDKQESIWIEHSDPEGAIIIKQAPEGGTSTILFNKWSEKVEGYGDNMNSPLCGGLYKEEDDLLFPR